MSEEDMKGPSIGTPLYEQIEHEWRKSLRQQAKENPQASQDDNTWTLDIVLQDDLELKYSQTALGDNRYLEDLVLRFEGVEERFSLAFSDEMGTLYRTVKTDEGLSTTEYDSPPLDLARKIAEAREEKPDRISAGTFASTFHDDFMEAINNQCRYIFLINGPNIGILADEEFIDDVKAAPSVLNGMRSAFIRHRGRMWGDTLKSHKAALDYFPQGKRIAVIAKEKYRPELILMLSTVADRIEENTAYIGSTEIMLMRGYHDMTAEQFLDCVFTPSVYDILPRVFKRKTKEQLMEDLWKAESSPLLRKKEQLEGIQKALADSIGMTPVAGRPEDMEELKDAAERKTGKSFEKLVGEYAAGFYDRVTGEYPVYKEELEVHRVKTWWDVFKAYVGMAPEMSLGAPEKEAGEPDEVWERRFAKWKQRQPDFRQRVVEAYSLFHPQLGSIDYDMFMYLSPERLPGKDAGQWSEKRTGVGNMIIDFGDRELFNWINFGAEHMQQELERAYAEQRDAMRVYLFKGHHILRPMLHRMFRKKLPDGGTVAVATCNDRLKELTEFCEIDNSGDLIYRQDGGDVRIVVLNRPANYDKKWHKIIL